MTCQHASDDFWLTCSKMQFFPLLQTASIVIPVSVGWVISSSSERRTFLTATLVLSAAKQELALCSSSLNSAPSKCVSWSLRMGSAGTSTSVNSTISEFAGLRMWSATPGRSSTSSSYAPQDAAKTQRGQRCLWAETHIVRIPGLCSLCAQEEAPTGDAWKHPSQHAPPVYRHLPFLCFSHCTFDLRISVMKSTDQGDTVGNRRLLGLKIRKHI